MIQKNARITTKTATHTPARDALDRPPVSAAPLESAAFDWLALDGAGVGGGVGEGEKGVLVGVLVGVFVGTVVGTVVGVMVGEAVGGLEEERVSGGEEIVVEPVGRPEAPAKD